MEENNNVIAQEENEEKVFSQDKMQEVALKNKQRGFNEALKKIGVEDLETAQKIINEYNSLKEEKMTQDEKLEQKRLQEEKRIELLREENKKIEQEQQNLKLENHLYGLGIDQTKFDDAKAFAQSYQGEDLDVKLNTYFASNTQVVEQPTSPNMRSEQPKKESVFSFENMLKIQ